MATRRWRGAGCSVPGASRRSPRLRGARLVPDLGRRVPAAPRSSPPRRRRPALARSCGDRDLEIECRPPRACCWCRRAGRRGHGAARRGDGGGHRRRDRDAARRWRRLLPDARGVRAGRRLRPRRTMVSRRAEGRRQPRQRLPQGELPGQLWLDSHRAGRLARERGPARRGSELFRSATASCSRTRRSSSPSCAAARAATPRPRACSADSPRSAAALRVLAEIALDEGDAATALALAREMEATVNGFPVTEHVAALQLVVRAAAAGATSRPRAALAGLERAASTIPTDAVCASVSVARAAVLAHAASTGRAPTRTPTLGASSPPRALRSRPPRRGAPRASSSVLPVDVKAADRAEASAHEQLQRLGHVRATTRCRAASARC